MKALRLLFLLVFVSVSHAQTLTVTKSQHEKLMKQRERLIAVQKKIATLQNEAAYELSVLQQNCREVIVANHWPENTQVDLSTLSFVLVPTAPPVSEKKPAFDPPSIPNKPEEKKP